MKSPQPRKTPGLVVNKAAEIRRAASLLVSHRELPRPSTIRELLRRRGIVVTSQQVSMALSNTEFAYRRNTPKWEGPRPVLPDPLECIRQTSRQNLDDAEELVRKVGSLKGAIASLVALGQLKREREQEPQYYGGA